jgi:hypothetical protein
VGKAVAERILKFHKHKRLIARIIKNGKPVVLVLLLGRPLVLVQENETVPAILNTWFAGSEAGVQLQMSCLVMKILLVN